LSRFLPVRRKNAEEGARISGKGAEQMGADVEDEKVGGKEEDQAGTEEQLEKEIALWKASLPPAEQAILNRLEEVKRKKKEELQANLQGAKQKDEEVKVKEEPGGKDCDQPRKKPRVDEDVEGQDAADEQARREAELEAEVARDKAAWLARQPREVRERHRQLEQAQKKRKEEQEAKKIEMEARRKKREVEEKRKRDAFLAKEAKREAELEKEVARDRAAWLAKLCWGSFSKVQ